MHNFEPDTDLYSQLADYTLSHRDPKFIHQYIVDAYAAQTADKNTKPIKITFALIGLYLYVEKNYTGREVQHIHTLLAKHRRDWPFFDLPESKGKVTITDVLKTPEGTTRDEEIRRWCKSVWEAFEKSHEQVEKLMKELLYTG